MVNTNPSFSQEDLKSFKDISFKLGSNSHLVQAAGGNTSIKSDGRMLIGTSSFSNISSNAPLTIKSSGSSATRLNLENSGSSSPESTQIFSCN